jgi:ferredoxin-NADP reductase
MKKHFVKITSIENINPDIIKMVTTKPIGFKFIPGQNVGISIDKPHWNQIKRPFTFTSIPSDDYLEFMIKIFRKHDGETNEMMSLSVNDELILHEVFGNIKFSEEGVFIAGGMGVTPFISIMRQLHFSNIVGNNKLI